MCYVEKVKMRSKSNKPSHVEAGNGVKDGVLGKAHCIILGARDGIYGKTVVFFWHMIRLFL